MKKLSRSRFLVGLVITLLTLSMGTAAMARQDQGAAAGEEKEKSAPAAQSAQPAKPVPATTSSRPPTRGRFVGDHWTPYEPPSAESFPQGSTVHVIVPHDTLWDLAGKYLENPYLWPQIWDVNQYVSDSHWIYPGDPLLIPGKPTVIGEKGPEPPIEVLEPTAGAVPAAPPEEQPAAQEPPAGVTLAPAGPVLSPVADEVDVYCSNYITDSFEEPALEIREREDGSRTILGTGDIVFLNQGMGGQLNAGDEFTVVIDEGIVPHPIFAKENVGTSVRMLGRVKVIALQERSATAEIVEACDGIEIGAKLIPFEEIPVPLTTPVSFRRYGVEMQTENAGYIVDVMPDKLNIGAGDIVNVDLGADNGLQPGDVLTIFREWGGTIMFDSTDSYIDNQQARAEMRRTEGDLDPGDYAQTILGQVVILRTQPKTSTAKVVVSAREINLGDRVGK
ncbi:MAG TPA: LysM peptidoglycan-binding domain-containing protein [Candidatus Polarisedimenticolia bacterium]|jgi:hypothetical protein